jgi:hypothetical protein
MVKPMGELDYYPESFGFLAVARMGKLLAHAGGPDSGPRMGPALPMPELLGWPL